MATMDIFNSDAFSMVELADALDKRPYQPSMLGRMNLFTERRIRTESVAIEERDGTLSLIQTSERGAPLEQRNTEKRKVRDFRPPRIAKQDVIRASEIAGIRAFGSETELMQVQQEVSRRLDGPTGLRREVELTWENMRLGAVQGTVVDADASTLFDWFTEFGVVQDAEIDFDLDNASPASGAVRKKCSQVVRQMTRAANGGWLDGMSYVVGLCGDNFWDDLTAHSEVRTTYLNTQQAADLRGGLAYEQFRYGGILWINYRGTDDASTVAVGTDKAKFFPANAPGVFQSIFAPGEFFDTINRPGIPIYPMIVPDSKRNAYVEVEVYSYPLFICTRPKMLQRAKRT